MKKLFFVALSLALFTCSHESSKTEFHCLGEPQEFVLKVHPVTGKGESFVSHIGEKKFERYLTLTLSYAPFSELFEEIQKSFGKLKNRADAHVTVITPPEYDEILSPVLSMSEINAIAEKFKIQESRLKVICLGQAQAQVAGNPESTYFIVLESRDLVDLRHQIAQAFIAKGGAASRFDPENFYPHITLGFSLRDLHESDGVRKGKNACVSKIK